MLLAADARLPSVAGLVAEAPLKGSWWGHPQGHAIFRVARELAAHPDVIAPRLIGGKVTFVHRKLWGALLRVAASRGSWQLQGLSPLAHSLLSNVTRNGVLRTDHLAATGRATGKQLGDAARELEMRLLAYGESIHTESGAHAKQLESWDHLARRVRITGRKMSLESAKKQFEEVAAALEAQRKATVHFPWGKN